jgi:hypothetical protein
LVGVRDDGPPHLRDHRRRPIRTSRYFAPPCPAVHQITLAGGNRMQLKAIDDKTTQLAFDLFHSFSRFEFAMKEAGWVANKSVGAKARPDWLGFVSDLQEQYHCSTAALALIAADPQVQHVAAGGNFEFRSVKFEPDASDLRKTVDLVHVVRNNLFHGGKSDSHGWDSAARIAQLAPLVLEILSELAMVGSIESDHSGIY